jgi:hypothetical protein
MYSSSDPRSRLESPYTARSYEGFAPAEYVKFHDNDPHETTEGSRTWYARGQNFVVAYTEVMSDVVLTREEQLDEYFVLLPDYDTVAILTTREQSCDVRGYSIAIMPPGRSKVHAVGGRVVRVFSARNLDQLKKCSNAAAYFRPHPNIPPYQPWPNPPDGFRIRHYSLDVMPQEGRFGRIWRSSTMMINVLPREGPRDLEKLSPHHHDDFEQGSLALAGSYTHHIRWPWGANLHHWREDEHEHCPAPSLTVIPPPAIHTSAATDPTGNQLVDIFCPPRLDFSKMAGWVLNAADYPMPEGSR